MRLALLVITCCLLTGAFVAADDDVKPVLARTVLPFRNVETTVGGVVSNNFVVELFVGDQLAEGKPIQKASFLLEFGSGAFLTQQYETECPSGLSCTVSAGFRKLSTLNTYFRRRNLFYTVSSYNAHIRFEGSDDAPAFWSQIIVNNECPWWMQHEGSPHGLLQLGPRSTFFQSLAASYYQRNSVSGSFEPIPVSWSLDPVDSKHLFDSRVAFKPGTFILNGSRTKHRVQLKWPGKYTDIWYYQSMAFDFATDWSLKDQTVCIDPNADTFIGLPEPHFSKAWKTIHDYVCSGESTETCDYSRAELGWLPPIQIDFPSNSSSTKPKSEFVDLGEYRVRLYGSDIIKQDAKGNYLGKGIANSANLSTVCDADDIVIGKWFFTKAELTFWVTSSDTPSISLSSFDQVRLMTNLPFLSWTNEELIGVGLISVVFAATIINWVSEYTSG